MAKNFFFENILPALYGQILGTAQPFDLSQAPYVLLPNVVYGSLLGTVVSKSANYTLTTADGIVLATTGVSGITLTLPDATLNSGRVYFIKKVDSGLGVLTIATTSSQTIDGETTQTIAYQYYSLTIISNGTSWYLI